MEPVRSNGTVVRDIPWIDGAGSGNDLLLYLVTSANTIPPWGTNVRLRDQELRKFYKRESYLSGTVYSITARYASFKWTLEGPTRQMALIHRMLHGCEHGKGWEFLMVPTVKDYLTQDNGSFIEFIRSEDSWKAPVIQLNHLDSARCFRTGNREVPVIYTDIFGGMHRMKWYQVYDLTEYPDPDERFRGYQECGVSRLLTVAQKIFDEETWEAERFSGRNPDRVHMVSGIQQQRIENILKIDQNRSDQEGYARYQIPSIVAALDPNANLKHEEIILRGAPDGYNKTEDIRWYTIALALAFGIDPQDIAPLPGGNLGSSQQSRTLHQKGRGKGPAMFMTAVQHMMNFHGVMPQTVQFKYQEQDIEEDEQLTDLKWRRTQMYRMLMGSGQETPILPPEVIRQMMRDNGDLREEYLNQMGEQDLTPSSALVSEEKPGRSVPPVTRIIEAPPLQPPQPAQPAPASHPNGQQP